MIKNKKDKIDFLTIKTPIGLLQARASEKKLLSVKFSENQTVFDHSKNKILLQTKKELDEYFQLKRKKFTLPLKLCGTPFQIQSWESLKKIPFGQTITYSEQAKLIDRPLAIRAVANANRKNQFLIIIPCHRVIGKNGSLTGYAGGISKKEFLISLESSS